MKRNKRPNSDLTVMSPNQSQLPHKRLQKFLHMYNKTYAFMYAASVTPTISSLDRIVFACYTQVLPERSATQPAFLLEKLQDALPKDRWRNCTGLYWVTWGTPMHWKHPNDPQLDQFFAVKQFVYRRPIPQITNQRIIQALLCLLLQHLNSQSLTC